MMGRQTVDQSQLFYLFNLEEQIPADHLLRRLNPIVTRVLVDLREKLAPFYSDIGRPPIAPALEKRIREALATPGRPGVRVIAKQFGVDPGTVQRISRPFDRVGIVAA